MQVAVGSLIEAQGSLYSVVTDPFTPTGTAQNGAYLFFDDSVPGYAWSTIAGTYDPTRGGIYDPGNRRQCRFLLRSATRFVQLSENGTPLGTLKILEIGDWNMDTTTQVMVAHGLTGTNWQLIRETSVIIRDDADSLYRPAQSSTVVSGAQAAWPDAIDSTNINLERLTGGFFDSILFSATSFNRGWVKLWIDI